MNTVHANRLLKLAAFLSTMPRAKFDFSTFVQRGEKPMLEALRAPRKRCGSVACAVGWMPAVFPRQLCWAGKDQPGGNLEVEFRHEQDDDDFGLSNFAVAERFFGLSYDEVRELFNPDNGTEGSLPWDATPKQVAREIRRFVRQKRRGAA